MTVRDVLKMVSSGEITNLDTEIVLDIGDNRYFEVSYWELGEHGLDAEPVYKQITTENSILILG